MRSNAIDLPLPAICPGGRRIGAPTPMDAMICVQRLPFVLKRICAISIRLNLIRLVFQHRGAAGGIGAGEYASMAMSSAEDGASMDPASPHMDCIAWLKRRLKVS